MSTLLDIIRSYNDTADNAEDCAARLKGKYAALEQEAIVKQVEGGNSNEFFRIKLAEEFKDINGDEYAQLNAIIKLPSLAADPDMLLMATIAKTFFQINTDTVAEQRANTIVKEKVTDVHEELKRITNDYSESLEQAIKKLGPVRQARHHPGAVMGGLMFAEGNTKQHRALSERLAVVNQLKACFSTGADFADDRLGELAQFSTLLHSKTDLVKVKTKDWQSYIHTAEQVLSKAGFEKSAEIISKKTGYK